MGSIATMNFPEIRVGNYSKDIKDAYLDRTNTYGEHIYFRGIHETWSSSGMMQHSVYFEATNDIAAKIKKMKVKVGSYLCVAGAIDYWPQKESSPEKMICKVYDVTYSREKSQEKSQEKSKEKRGKSTTTPLPLPKRRTPPNTNINDKAGEFDKDLADNNILDDLEYDPFLANEYTEGFLKIGGDGYV